MRIFISILIATAALALTATSFAQSWDHRDRFEHRWGYVMVRGDRMNYDRDEMPYRSQGTLFMPFRRTAAQIGGRADRSPSGRIAILDYRGDHLEYAEGSYFFRINGRRFNLDQSAESHNGILFLPYQVFKTLTHGGIDWRFDRRDSWR